MSDAQTLAPDASNVDDLLMALAFRMRELVDMTGEQLAIVACDSIDPVISRFGDAEARMVFDELLRRVAPCGEVRAGVGGVE